MLTVLLQKDQEQEEADGKVKDMLLGNHEVIQTDGEESGWMSAREEVMLSWKKKMEILEVALVFEVYPYFYYNFPVF